MRHSGRWLQRVFARAAACCCLTAVLVAEPASERGGALRGLPLSRFYSFDEVGDVSRGARLALDVHGRIAAVQDGAFVVLNDNTWLDLATKQPNGTRLQHAVRDADGTVYYGGQGSYGILRPAGDGSLAPESLLPTNAPAWVPATSFAEILCRPEGVYFGGFNGFAFRARATGRTSFLPVSGLAAFFAIDDQVYVSSHSGGVQVLDFARAEPLQAAGATFAGHVVDQAARLGDGRWLISTTGRGLYTLQHQQLTRVAGALGERLNGRIAAMRSLAEGGVAVAVAGQGLYILGPGAEVEVALTSPEYHRVNALETNEPGVLWAATENGIAKLLYGAPVTWFGQALGLPVRWPQLVRWDDAYVIASNGRLFESNQVSPGEPTQFRLVSGQPADGTWGIATSGGWLLVGNGDGLYGRRPGEQIRQLQAGLDASRLAVVGNVCFAIGMREIAAFRLEGDTWRECAPRVESAGYPSLVQVGLHAAWVEIGANRALRVAFGEGRIRTRLFDTFPWQEPRWINVSLIDDLAILSGPDEGRLIFDERTEQLVAHAPIVDLLNSVRFWPSRVMRDETGILWLSHDRGIMTLVPEGEGYRADAQTFRVLTDHVPLIREVAPGEIWISSGNSLYQATERSPRPHDDRFRVALVSARDLRTNRELLKAQGNDFGGTLPFSRNSLGLRFFSGTYAFKRAPVYEFRINEGDWSSLESTSMVRLDELREGRYRLDVRLLEHSHAIGTPLSVTFAIAPPWYRTWLAFAAYGLAALVTIVGIVRLAVHRTRTRNAELERTVAQRTEELKSAMQRLQVETQAAATLAERNRLAGEIHDSLEQGFSGLMLHLETTAGLAACPPEISGGLTVARSMVAFSRNEVRHAVWDLHSPLLDSGGLEAALRNIVTQLAPEPARATIHIEGVARSVGSTTEHHLLRIAQEAIANAVKHAAASHLEIRLVFSGVEIVLSVKDDGRGFDPRAVLSPPGGHFGLRSLRSRASKIGAHLDIASAPGAGTAVTVRAPLAVQTL